MLSSEMDTRLRRIGEYLPCSSADIERALSIQARELASGNEKPIGEILLEDRLVTQEALQQALQSQLIDRLKKSSLLTNLDRDQLAQIGARTEKVSLDPGETLFKQGNRGNSLYVVLRGRLLLSRLEDLNEFASGAAIPGDVLGETEFFTDGTRDRTAYATEQSLLLKVGYCLVPECERKKEKTAPRAFSNHIIRRACAALRADRVYLFVRDQETGDLATRIDMGDRLREYRMTAGADIVGWVALRKEIVNLREAYLDSRFNPALDIHTGYWTRTLLAAPVLDEDGKVMGVLEAVNKKTGWFDSDEEALLRAFARQCAAVIRSGNIPPCPAA